MIAYFVAEATRLECTLTQPLDTDSDDLDDASDLFLEPDNIGPDERSLSTATEAAPKKQSSKQPEKRKSLPTATEAAPKKKQSSKQPEKRKSPSKTTTEGTYSQYFVSWSLAEYLISC